MSDSTPTLDPLRVQDGFADLLGYQLVRWQADEADVALLVEKRHLNRSGLMHGGVLCTLLDTACGYAGCYVAIPGRRRRALTLSLNTQFIGAGRLGMRLLATGRRTGGGRSIFFSRAEVRDETGVLIGSAEGAFKYRGNSGDPEGEAIPPGEAG